MARKIRPPRSISGTRDIESKLGTGRILLDPDLLPGSGSTEFSVLPLLFDKLIVPNPAPDRITGWGLDSSRLRALAEAKMLVPLAAGDLPLENFPPISQVTRSEILPDDEFYALYQRAVAADLEDPDFQSIVDEISRGIGHGIPKDVVAFDANWDFLLSLRLNAPVASNQAIQHLWSYKLSSLGDPHQPGVPPLHESAKDLFAFLAKYTLRLPSSLTIDELRGLRKEAAARKFRVWFWTALSRARTRSSATGIAADELLLREFRELLSSHASRIERGAEIVTASVMAGVGLILGPAEGIASAVTYPVFKGLVSKAVAIWGPQRWMEVIAGLSDRGRAG